jgi:serine/threonine protein kinase/tetratricopeptide (TPR) repeat protein
MHKFDLKEEEQVILVSSEEESKIASDEPAKVASGRAVEKRADTVEDSTSSKPHQNTVGVTSKSQSQTVIAGKYEVISLLGEGGMSRVYKAQDVHSGKIVALKTIRPERLQDERSIERFIHECQVVSSLEHRNIAATGEFGVDADGTPYLQMEYVDGITLAELVKQEGAIDVDRALQIMLQIIAGLSYAHEKGIIHRDIKPSNVILSRTTDGKDRVQIVDFGIARVFDHLSSAHMPLTQTGEALGTPWYMSPEQCFGKIADERSDIYQLGCLFQELLTGKRAFEGDTAFEVMFKHVTGAPKLEGIDSNLQEILSKTLNKNPEDRYHSVPELEKEIRDFAEARASGATNRSLLKQVESHSVLQITGRRACAAALDAVLIGLLSAIFTWATTFSSMYRFYPGYWVPDDRFYSSLFGFILGCVNALAIWPSALLAAIPYRISADSFLRDVPGFIQSNQYVNQYAVIPILVALVTWLYFAFFESSKLRGTPGKIIFGLKVQTAGPNRASFWQSSQRFFLRALTSLCLPELLRGIVEITRSKRNLAEQLTLQLRLPIHDSLSNCVIVKADRKKERKLTILGVSAFIMTSLFFAAPWLAIYFEMPEPVIAINPNFAPAYEIQADKRLNTKDYQGAASDYAKVEKLDPSRTYPYHKHMTALVQQKKFEEAMKVGDEGIKQTPEHSELSTLLRSQALIALQSTGDNKLALKLLKQIPARFLDRHIFAKVLNTTGNTAEADLQTKLAEDYLNREAEGYEDARAPEMEIYNHTHPNVFLDRAMLRLSRGNLDGALSDLNRGLADLERIRSENKSRQRFYEHSEIVGPIHFYKAETLSRQGKAVEARNELEEALKAYTAEIDKKSKAKVTYVEEYYQLGQNYLGRAKVYSLLGKTDLAKKDKDKAKSLEVNYDFDGHSPNWWTN